MKKILLILGNITFHHFNENELKLFSDPEGEKALVHHVDAIIMCESEDDAAKIGDDMVNMFDSYLIPESFSGEIVYESVKVRSMVESFIDAYSNF